MKKSGLLTNVQSMVGGGKDKTVPVKSNLKSGGNKSSVEKVKAKQKSPPVGSGKLGNHWK